MLSVQLGSSRRAWAALFACVFASLVFGLIWALLLDWVAAALCLVGLVGAARMALLLRRRAGADARADTTMRGRASAHAADGSLFTSFAQETVGARVREGVVVIGSSTAAFVCLGGWRHLAWKLIAAPFRVRLRFVDLAIEMPVRGDLEPALRDAVARRGGFIIDREWTYASSQRWLIRPGGKGIVWIERPVPDALTSQWVPVPPPTPAKFRSARNRIVAVGSGVVSLLALAGVVAWRLTGDADYLVAALAYAALVAVALVAGLVIAQRRLAPADPPR